MIKSVEVKHGRTEQPKDFYQRLKHAFFQGRSGPGLVEDQAFKSLFVHNLHPCVHTSVNFVNENETKICSSTHIFHLMRTRLDETETPINKQ